MSGGGGWIGVDFDGTLSHYESDQFPAAGRPLMPMVERVREWLAEGREVRIVTARAGVQPGPSDPRSALTYDDCVGPVHAFCEEWFGRRLMVTDRKDFAMIALWDDRAIRVVTNTGHRA